MTFWEYCILTRLSAGLDTKWYVNRVFQHSETQLPDEVTADEFRSYNERFDALHATKIYPILPAVLNELGADGWELIDDMQTGMAGGEGLVFKRPLTAARRGRVARQGPRTAKAAKTATKKRSVRRR